jgi:NADPH-dependent 2,4-dienoyl-CoA reductase/sulfur reductase-like enzyme
MPGIVIVGGGLASARVVKGYRDAGGGERLRLVSADSALPYHRPPLSKRYLRGETDDPPLVEQRDFYEQDGVEVSLDTLVASLDADERRLGLSTGGYLDYDRLVIASGARPRSLGIPGAGGERVFTLRTLADSDAIREAARGARRAVVVGAGFIGMEVTASLRALGVEVTLVHRGRGLFESLGSPPLAAYLSELYRERGVDVLLGDELTEIRDGAAVTRSGRELAADLVVLGLGVEPWVDWLEGAGLELDDGVVVNERFETSVPDVFAVGDVARFQDPVFGKRRRIEHWSNANYQGAELGKILATGEGGYDVVSTFFSEVFGVTLKVFGDAHGSYDAQATRGSFVEGAAITFSFRDGRFVAATLTGQDEETEDRLREALREQPETADPEGFAAGF